MKKIVITDLQSEQLELSPARYQLLEELADKGYETYVVLPGKLKMRRRFPYIHHVINATGMTTKTIRNKIISINPEIVIATFYEDMKVVYFLPFVMKHTVFYYYNLEILTPYISKEFINDNLRSYIRYKIEYPIRKLQEIIYTRNVKLFIIQDDLRRRLSEKYHIKHRNTLLIPNSYVLDCNSIIDEPGTGIIYSGGIKRAFLIGQFDKLKKIKNISVTFSGHMDQWCQCRAIELKKTNPNIKFYEKNLSPEEHTEYLRKFAVGLVWYSPLKEDEQNYYIGLASGKMFKHLSLGQPIIAVKCPGITAEVNKYKLGVVIDDISELEEAYAKIISNYKYYQSNIISTYKKKYDFKQVIKPLLECIEKDVVEVKF